MTSLAAKRSSQNADLADRPKSFAEGIDSNLSSPAPSGTPSWMFAVKVAMSLALIAALVFSVDSRRISDILINAAPLPFIAAVLAFSVQCVIAALRCRAVVGSDWRISIPDHIRFFWIGQFFNQLLPSTIGGDAVRAWLLSRCGPTLPTAIKFILVDRLSGVIALMLAMVLLASLPARPLPLIGEASRTLGMIAVLSLSGLALTLLIVRQQTIARFLKSTRFLKSASALFDELAGLIRSPGRAAQVFGLALMVHACSILAFWLAARSIGQPLGLFQAAVIVPPMLLIAMMPISVAGWGVREGVVLVGLRFQGISAEASISIALLFGLALLIASLPGSLLWLTCRPKRWRK